MSWIAYFFCCSFPIDVMGVGCTFQHEFEHSSGDTEPTHRRFLAFILTVRRTGL